MTSIYQAIMLAADHIEKHPQEFNFNSLNVPDGPGCGTCGCALGWIGFFGEAKSRMSFDPKRIYRGIAIVAGISIVARCADSEPSFMRISQADFYARMGEIGGGCWKTDAVICAKSLRLYAAKYHATKQGIPTAVLALFDPNVAQVNIDRIKA